MSDCIVQNIIDLVFEAASALRLAIATSLRLGFFAGTGIGGFRGAKLFAGVGGDDFEKGAFLFGDCGAGFVGDGGRILPSMACCARDATAWCLSMTRSVQAFFFASLPTTSHNAFIQLSLSAAESA